MALEHSAQRSPDSVTPLDPFWIKAEALGALVTQGGRMQAATEIGGIDPRRNRRSVVFHKSG